MFRQSDKERPDYRFNTRKHGLLLMCFISYSYGASVNFTEGRCPGSRVMIFEYVLPSVMVPNVNIGDCDYTIAFWMRLSQRTQGVLVLGSSRSGKFLSLYIQEMSAIICREVSTRIDATCVRTGSVAFMNGWIHIAVTCKQDNEVKMFINGETFSSVSMTSMPLPDVFNGVLTMPHKESFIIYYLSSPLLMDLHIFGFALPRDEIYDLYRG